MWETAFEIERSVAAASLIESAEEMIYSITEAVKDTNRPIYPTIETMYNLVAFKDGESPRAARR